jgi:hypothetical protein
MGSTPIPPCCATAPSIQTLAVKRPSIQTLAVKGRTIQALAVEGRTIMVGDCKCEKTPPKTSA